ncbi:hypothetical protein GGX14DRAFT_393120 [Mycena pura]|uniref:Uncharacterized protein n=1 Tax=Mycena pura TaxID=153505 RepID=A0AAD6VQT1_9AGAR|nr:hypothetical protein GGX14DRAFT_393120 [Mycena pura]
MCITATLYEIPNANDGIMTIIGMTDSWQPEGAESSAIGLSHLYYRHVGQNATTGTNSRKTASASLLKKKTNVVLDVKHERAHTESPAGKTKVVLQTRHTYHKYKIVTTYVDITTGKSSAAVKIGESVIMLTRVTRMVNERINKIASHYIIQPSFIPTKSVENRAQNSSGEIKHSILCCDGVYVHQNWLRFAPANAAGGFSTANLHKKFEATLKIGLTFVSSSRNRGPDDEMDEFLFHKHSTWEATANVAAACPAYLSPPSRPLPATHRPPARRLLARRLIRPPLTRPAARSRPPAADPAHPPHIPPLMLGARAAGGRAAGSRARRRRVAGREGGEREDTPPTSCQIHARIIKALRLKRNLSPSSEIGFRLRSDSNTFGTTVYNLVV